MVDTTGLPPSVVAAIEAGETSVFETPISTTGSGLISGSGGTIESRLATQAQAEAQPGVEITQAEIQRRVEERARVDEARKAEQAARKERILIDTPEKQALALAAAQKQLPIETKQVSPKFGALRAQRLAEAKQQIKEPTQVDVQLGGGLVSVSGEVRPFLPEKRPEDTAVGGTAKRLVETGFDVDVRDGLIIAEKGGRKDVLKISPQITEFVEKAPLPLIFQESRLPFIVERTFGVGLKAEKLAEVPADAIIETQIIQTKLTKDPPRGLSFQIIQKYEDIGKGSPFFPVAEKITEKVTKITSKEKKEDVKTFRDVLDVTVPKIIPSFRGGFETTKRSIDIRTKATRERLKGRGPLKEILLKGIEIQAGIEKTKAGIGTFALEEIREEPSKAVTSFLAGASITGGLGFTISLFPKAVIPITRTLKVGGKGLLVTFAGITGAEIALAEPEQRIEIIGRRVGEIAPFVLGGIAGKGIAKAEIRRARPKKIITFRETSEKLTKKEIKAIEKFAESPEDDPIKKTLKELSPGIEKEFRVDINRLTDKQLIKIIKLQSRGKLESAFELTTKVTQGKVGLTFKSRRGTAQVELEGRKRASKQLIDIFNKEQRKAEISAEKEAIARRVGEAALEKRIRAEIKRTGKTAQEIFKGIEKEEKIIKTIKGDVPKVKVRESGTITRSPPGADPFKGLRESFRIANTRIRLFPRQQKLIFTEEQQFFREAKPISDKLEVIFPSVKQLQRASGLTKLVQSPVLLPTPSVKTLSNTFLDAKQRLTQDTSQLAKQASSTIQELQQEVIQQQSLIQQPILELAQVQETVQKQEQITSQITKLDIGIEQKLEQEVIAIPFTETKLELKQKIELVPDEPIQEIPRLPKFKLEKRIEKRKQGFDAFVRQRQKLVKINKQPLPLNTATNLALKIADESPAVVAKIKPSKQPTKIKFDQTIDPFLRKKFEIRKDQLEKGNIFVEKNQFRIDSFGEIAGIQKKGVAARRAGRFF